ncbi:PD-(D/E)XK nuclease family protein [Posidoniimonas corsicana]|nr:PD-(D/E)XK nuclease family protein [Posidoniimonas corsicana]
MGTHPAPGLRLWLAPTTLESARLTGVLATLTGGMLAPGIKPLYQAADAVVSAAPEPIRPLSRVARSRLIEEILHRGSFSGRFRLLTQARGSAGGLDYVATALEQFAMDNLTPEELFDQTGAIGDARISELARAYQDYTQECRRHRLMDRSARLRYACELFESGAAPGGAPEMVAASGLDRLEMLEARFLQAVLRSAGQWAAAFTVNGPEALASAAAGQTATLYDGPAATVRRLRSLFPASEITWVESRLPDADARRHALDAIFRDPRDARRRAGADQRGTGIVVHGAAGLQEEAESAAHRAKQLLRSGVPAADIVVAARGIGGWAPRLREAFAQAGVPLAVEGAATLGQTAVGRVAALVLRLATDDWTYDAVHSAVTLPSLGLFDTPLDDDERRIARRLGLAGRRAAVEWVLNELLYPKGRRQLLDRVNWLASQNQASTDNATADDEPPDRRRERLTSAATLALPALQTLAEVTQTFYHEADPLGWHDRLAGAIATLGYRPTDQTAQRDDEAALAALEDAFASLQRLSEQRRAEEQRIPLAEAHRLVQGWLSRVPLDVRWDAEGRVRALSAETASQTPCEHLLLVGLDEQSFPRPDSAIAIGSADDQLRSQQASEMLLFCKLLATPRQAVYLSYAALDAKAQTLNPSSYVAELERLFPRRQLRTTADPGEQAPQDPQQLRRHAVRRLMEGDAGPLAQVVAGGSSDATGAALAAGLLASHERSHGDSFGAYEGVLTSAEAQASLDARFGPEHLWSASQLEQYGTCPFKFYLRHVLRADPVESLALDVDYRRRGSLLHDAMVRFHRQVNQLIGQGAATSTLDAEAFSAAFGAAIQDAFEALATAPHEAAVAEIEAMQAAAWSEEYQRQHRRYDDKNSAFVEPLVPRHFEARFGPAVASTGEAPDPLSTPEPFALQAGDYRILLTGQVDRIDVGRVGGQAVFNVIDYKTAKSLKLKQEDIESGRLLQMVLYTIAVSDHLFAGQDVAPWRSGYWAVQENGFKFGKLPQPGERADGGVVLAEDWNELVQAVRERVGQIVRNVRAARFPMFNTDEDCGGRCEYRTVCRVAQARSLAKTPDGEDG